MSAGPTRYGADRAAVEELLASWGEPRYSADQVWEGLYGQRRPLAEITSLPRSLRERLDQALPEALSARAEQTGDAGTTRKWLWEAREGAQGPSGPAERGAQGPSGPAERGAQLETVLMTYPDRATVCVSSQAGCAMACSFCATGQAGFERHLTTGEIVEQVARAQHALGSPGSPDGAQRISNVVFMGMGEPLANEEPVWQAVERLHQDLGISARNITVSTVGVAPAMRRLARRPLPVTLAVSLHAPDDVLREELVPLDRRYPLGEVLGAAREYVEAKGRRVSFEYVMLDGVNDGLHQAERLAGLLAGPDFGLAAHVNLIPYNPTPGLDAGATPPERLRAFAAALRRRGISATIRRNRGVDIDAACGQLRSREAPEPTPGDGRAVLIPPRARPGARMSPSSPSPEPQ